MRAPRSCAEFVARVIPNVITIPATERPAMR
jgi:hypothetical protein